MKRSVVLRILMAMLLFLVFAGVLGVIGEQLGVPNALGQGDRQLYIFLVLIFAAIPSILIMKSERRAKITSGILITLLGVGVVLLAIADFVLSMLGREPLLDIFYSPFQAGMFEF